MCDSCYGRAAIDIFRELSPCEVLKSYFLLIAFVFRKEWYISGFRLNIDTSRGASMSIWTNYLCNSHESDCHQPPLGYHVRWNNIITSKPVSFEYYFYSATSSFMGFYIKTTMITFSNWYLFFILLKAALFPMKTLTWCKHLEKISLSLSHVCTRIVIAFKWSIQLFISLQPFETMDLWHATRHSTSKIIWVRYFHVKEKYSKINNYFLLWKVDFTQKVIIKSKYFYFSTF